MTVQDVLSDINSLARVERILVDESGSEFGLVTLNRPEALNPIDWEMIVALSDAFEELADDQHVRVIGVTGEGRAFSAGGDMKKYKTLERDRDEFPRFMEDLHRMFTRIGQYPKPVLALVNGVAVAGGFELILHSDVAIAAESAMIGDAHLPYGQMGGGGSLTLLPRTVGPARARELIFTGRLLAAREAQQWGIIADVVPDNDLKAAGVAFAASVAKKSSLAIRNAKQVLNSGFWEGTGIPSSLRLEREVTNRYCLMSDDALEGIDAFAEKREPRYRGT